MKIRLLLMFVGLTIGGWATAADFQGLGQLPDGTATSATAVTADGLYVAGTAVTSSGLRAFRYHVGSQTMFGLGVTGGFTGSTATGISDDGHAVSGGLSDGTNVVPFIWREGTGLVVLPHDPPPSTTIFDEFTGEETIYQPPETALARAISGNGAIVIGEGTYEVQQAVRWNRSGSADVLSLLPHLWPFSKVGAACAISSPLAGGSPTVVGAERSAAGRQAFQLRTESMFVADASNPAGGTYSMVETLRGLGFLPGRNQLSEALGVSASGETIVGRSLSGNVEYRSEAFRVRSPLNGQPATMEGLGFLPGFLESFALDVSADGSQVVGYAKKSTGECEAVLWDPNTGMRSIRQVLVDAGVNLTKWVLTSATGISDDRRTVVGTGLHAGREEAWLAVIPTAPVFLNGGAFSGSAGQPFDLQLQASKAPSWYTATGLPSGLSIDSVGRIRGVLNPPGVYDAVVSATNDIGTGRATLHFTIGPPEIRNAVTARGAVELPFSYQILADREPITVTVSGLPEGLSLHASTRTISGTPREEGLFPLLITATNVVGPATATVNLTIEPPALGFTSDSIASGVVNRDFSFQITATENPTGFGAATPLPPGLQISTQTGLITGTPFVTGVYAVSITATNNRGTGNYPLIIAIAPPDSPSGPSEETYGHGLVISSLVTDPADATVAKLKIKNSSSFASYSIRVKLFVVDHDSPNDGSESTLYDLPALPAGGESQALEIRVESAYGYNREYFAVVFEVFENAEIPQASGRVASYYYVNSSPPSGGSFGADPKTPAPNLNLPQLNRVALSGPANVDESSSGQYTAAAVMSDGTTLAGSVVWGTSGTSLLSISDSGLLATGAVASDTAAKVTATITVAGVTKSASKLITIRDLTPRVTITASDPFAREAQGTDPGAFLVRRSRITNAPLTVKLKSPVGTALASDFEALPATVVIPAGAATIEFPLRPVDDKITEDNETVDLAVDVGTGYVVGTPALATVTIIGTVSVQFASAAQTVSETDGVVEIPVVRLGDSKAPVTVDFTVTALKAKAGLDFTLQNGTLSIPAGQTRGVIKATILDDAKANPGKTFNVTLSNASPGLSLGDPVKTTITIADDELISFTPFQGNYTTLVQPDAPEFAHSGLLNINLTGTGSFSASLLLGGQRYPFSGKLDAHGQVASVKSGKSAFTMSLQLNTTGGQQIAAQLLDHAVPFCEVRASRALYSAAAQPIAPFLHVPLSLSDSKGNLGKYTALLQTAAAPNGGLAATAFPQGDGWANVTLSSSGIVSVVGKLADGSPVTFANALPRSNVLPVYIPLHGGKGSLHGRVVFDPAQAQTDAFGSLIWFKPPNPADRFYRSGWPNGIGANFVASKLILPTVQTAANPLPVYVLNTDNILGLPGARTPTSCLLELAEGGTSGYVSNVTVDGKSKLTVVGTTGAPGLVATLAPKTGILTGTFLHPGTGKSTAFSGLVLQKTHTIGGYFLYTPPTIAGQPVPAGVSGSVFLAPHP